MSAFLAFADQAGAYILSDGAVVSPDGRLAGIEHKTRVSAKGDVAAVIAGGQWWASIVGGALMQMADQLDAAATLAELQTFAYQVKAGTPRVRLKAPEAPDETFEIDVLVAAFVPGQGGSLRMFRTRDGSMCRGPQQVVEPAFLVIDRGASFATHKVDLAAIGVPTKRAEETAAEWLRRHGGAIMECIRRQRIDYRGSQMGSYGVGGHVDMTLITADGCASECVKRWPDVIGQAINPIV